MTERELVGPVPKGPAFMGPFSADGDHVVGEDGRPVLRVDGDMSTMDEDARLAEVTADLLNAKFGFIEVVEPADDSDGFRWYEVDNDHSRGGFAVYANSQTAASDNHDKWNTSCDPRDWNYGKWISELSESDRRSVVRL